MNEKNELDYFRRFIGATCPVCGKPLSEKECLSERYFLTAASLKRHGFSIKRTFKYKVLQHKKYPNERAYAVHKECSLSLKED